MYAIAHEQLSGAGIPEHMLIPKAARPGYIPVTGWAWLEELRERHDGLSGRLAVEVEVPARVRREHAAGVASWNARVRAAARAGGRPPEWSADLSSAWVAGCVDAVEDSIGELVGDVRRVLADVDAAIVEHAGELDALRGDLDDGYGGALAALERELVGDAAEGPRPSWAPAFDAWRSRGRLEADLETYMGRRHGYRPAAEQIINSAPRGAERSVA
jgi:hypothetical protein